MSVAEPRSASRIGRALTIWRGGEWGISVPAYGLIFAGLSALYGLAVFPDELNHLSRPELLEIVKRPVTFLDRVYLPLDSANYLASAHQPLGQILQSAVAVGDLSFGLFSNISVILIGKFALTVWPSHPLFVVAIVNHVLLGLTVVHYRTICERMGLDSGRFLALLLANPIVVFVVWTLNKEAVGLFLVAGMIRYALDGRRLPLVLLVLVALYTRNVLFGFGLVMLARPLLLRLRPWVLLVAASLVWPVILLLTHDQPFGPAFGNLDNLTKAFDQQTRPLLVLAFQLMKLPFGYVFAWPIVTAIDIASPVLNPRYWESYAHHLNLAQTMLQLSSACFVALLAYTVWHARLRTLRLEPVYLFFVYTLITSVLPLSQHRYLVPAYPIVVLGALAAMCELAPDRRPARLGATGRQTGPA
jgi:hypothetical protein